MLKSARKFLILAAFAVALSPLAAPAAEMDPVLGTWKLNVGQSKFSPGPAPKSQTRTYKDSNGSTALNWTQVAADGKETTVSMTVKYDGKDYPVTGATDFDTIAVKRVDDRTVESSQKKAGKVVGTTIRTESKDGKTLTLKSKGTNAAGVVYDNTMVFDKQ
jgi:hypothetical protein